MTNDTTVECIDLVLTVNKADGLAAKDTNFLGYKTKSDPFIEVRLIPNQSLDPEAQPVAEKDKLFVGKTSIKMKTLAPKWDEPFYACVPRKEFGELSLFELSIWDYDKTKSNDIMGVVPVHIPVGRWGTVTKWYGVPASSAGGFKAKGRVQCTLSVQRSRKNPEEIEAANKQQNGRLNENERDIPELVGGKVEIIQLDLTVKRATGLAAMDTNLIGMKTKSDPYIEVRLCPRGPGGGEQTKVLLGTTEPQMQTLNPRYNQTFQAPPLSIKSFSDTAMFELTIMDFDDDGEDDLMGVVDIPIPLTTEGNTTKWYEVPKDSGKKGKASGQVQCMLSINKVLQQADSNLEADTELRLKAALAGKSNQPRAGQTTSSNGRSVKTTPAKISQSAPALANAGFSVLPPDMLAVVVPTMAASAISSTVAATSTMAEAAISSTIDAVASAPAAVAGAAISSKKALSTMAESAISSTMAAVSLTTPKEPLSNQTYQQGNVPLRNSGTSAYTSSNHHDEGNRQSNQPTKCVYCEQSTHERIDCPEWKEFQRFKKQKEKEKEKEQKEKQRKQKEKEKEEEKQRTKSVKEMKDRLAKRSSSSGSSEKSPLRRCKSMDGRRSVPRSPSNRSMSRGSSSSGKKERQQAKCVLSSRKLDGNEKEPNSDPASATEKKNSQPHGVAVSASESYYGDERDDANVVIIRY